MSWTAVACVMSSKRLENLALAGFLSCIGFMAIASGLPPMEPTHWEDERYSFSWQEPGLNLWVAGNSMHGARYTVRIGERPERSGGLDGHHFHVLMRRLEAHGIWQVPEYEGDGARMDVQWEESTQLDLPARLDHGTRIDLRDPRGRALRDFIHELAEGRDARRLLAPPDRKSPPSPH